LKPGVGARLVGRDDELASFDELIDAASHAHGQVLVVDGEAGIGKTRLVGEAIALARRRGFQVFCGACDDLDRARPFAAIADALGVSDASGDRDQIAIRELLMRDDLASSPRAALVTSGLQYRVVEALGAFVERCASSGSVLLVLEDLHWADPSTLMAVRSVARRIQQLPVVIIATTRSGHANTDLHRVVDDTLRAGGRHMPIGPLADDAVATLVRSLLETEPTDALFQRVRGAASTAGAFDTTCGRSKTVAARFGYRASRPARNAPSPPPTSTTVFACPHG